VADAVLREEARLEVLVGDLLTLARDDEAATVADTGVDLAAVVAEEAARARPVPVEVVAGPAVVRGDPRALGSLVAHLLDNAARHARTRVEGHHAASDHEVVLSVDDDGDGVPDADRERVFERFVRLDEGRARDRGGAGLGLAVVRTVARSHGGDARVGASPSGGARVVVALAARRGAAGA
jgi:signal transduction histidine kinase